VKYVHERSWGEDLRERIKSRAGIQSSMGVGTGKIRKAFDRGEEVSPECQLACHVAKLRAVSSGSTCGA